MRCPTRDLLARRPERLVVSGFRNIMAAYDLGDASCWDAVWDQFIAELGAPWARRLVGELQYWTRCVRITAERPLAFFPQCCLQLCHDECMALSLVAAAQAGDEHTGLLAIQHLTGCNDTCRMQDAWFATLPFATALKCANQIMYPVNAASCSRSTTCTAPHMTGSDHGP